MSSGMTHYNLRALSFVQTQALWIAISREVFGPYKLKSFKLKNNIISWAVDVRYSDVILRKTGSLSKHALWEYRNKTLDFYNEKYWNKQY